MQTLHVDLGDRSYPIYIGKSLIEQPELLLKHISGKQVLVVTNETVAPLYLAKVRQSLQGLQYSEVILPDGEQHKTLTVLATIYDQLLKDKHNRSTTLIALGGGVVGDMTGYAAASYQRGVNFIQIPTTLLSQVDSSVGGKTGVNHPLGKNMIGAFHQPQCVIADTHTLMTLPDRELSAGIAEVIKYGLICDAEFYQWLDENASALLARDESVLAEAIYRSCLNKAQVVAEDEKESGIRAILNLGHTFGHAIETAQGYGNWLHGEAVAAGMVLAIKLSAQLGWVQQSDVDSLERMLRAVNLPITPPAMSQQQFLELMMVDKKVLDGQLRLVLLERIGKAIVTGDITIDDVKKVLANAGVPA
ncbi:3-dehydroquinate synthase [Dasania sp. GY-MA-18]|uniref:3-dehydroquinate synthase n=1 Tax=Dasania phycosphaerae TaxID=2950436 RepID=A0A9J6RKA8_9GAMM|nr:MULTISPECIES: 3-dehydroquinate synthase [Dasania]MCR8922414.1 3-dehydroquinate synthase [Dasania sp. GY-MA-18]MCZ0864842.1 3-dehydroquinate synthase [Dasania phycosphaerae]MCZ0868570.1 3-dehydroquinate synthase [Dasania phycosphaerae]